MIVVLTYQSLDMHDTGGQAHFLIRSVIEMGAVVVWW